MSDRDLKDIIKEAAEAAAVVPKHLQEAAFNRAIDLMTKSGLPADSPPVGRSKAKPKRKPASAAQESGDDPVKTLLSEMDRTKHSEIFNAPRVLERSLFLLRAVRDDHDIDGLSAPQIAEVLTQKFRLKTTRQAVNGALNSDSSRTFVDVRQIGGTATYHLMQPGDDYLEAGDFSTATSGGSSRSKKTRSKKKTTKKAAASKPKSQNSGSKKVSKKKKSTSGRPGPGAMLKQLAEEGFFDTPRLITDIQTHCEKNLAHNYSVQELSTPLRRAIHNKLLKRNQNDEGQYEYTAV